MTLMCIGCAIKIESGEKKLTDATISIKKKERQYTERTEILRSRKGKKALHKTSTSAHITYLASYKLLSNVFIHSVLSLLPTFIVNVSFGFGLYL